MWLVNQISNAQKNQEKWSEDWNLVVVKSMGINKYIVPSRASKVGCFDDVIRLCEQNVWLLKIFQPFCLKISLDLMKSSEVKKAGEGSNY